MNRRQYLIGAGTGISTLPLVSSSGGATGHISIDIVETNAPLEGGDLLEMTAELENSGSADERVDLDFLIGEDAVMVGERTVPVGAGETRTVDFLQFRTYPVRGDDTFPVRLETGVDTAETTVTVTGVDPCDAQYTYPDRSQKLTVQPETTIIFEVDAELVQQQGSTHWYVDGDYVTTPAGPWSSTYFADVGRELFTHTFDSTGSHLVDTAVTADDGNTASRWEVTVAEDGLEPPTVDATRPTSRELAADETTTLELDVSSAATELDRVVWWMSQSDVILGVSDLTGSSDTATIQVDGGCHTCQIEAWVIDENNMHASVSPWQFEGFGAGDDGENGGSVTVRIQGTNSPVTGGEVLEVDATLENTDTSEVTREVALVVGNNPETVDTQAMTVPAGGTEQITLVFETYPVKQDDEFPVRVETGESTAERGVYVHGTES
ncbi:hypothetical protein [Natrinema salinisoli]|uniref:hypothetical protein n=1 Tax=Natrinema salinisoli TaxID=2878535 RepID=UPI001CF09013|nr:hypothetical protein [Natrinema salinisoli]